MIVECNKKGNFKDKLDQTEDTRETKKTADATSILRF